MTREHDGHDALTSDLAAVDRRRRFPASFAQEDHWLFEQLQGADSISVEGTIAGAFDVDALRRSVAEVVARHDILRTVFESLNGELTQIVDGGVRPDLKVIDASDTPLNERDAEARGLAVEQARAEFDLASGPLLKITAVKFGDEDHRLIVSAHHAILDARSMTLFVHELDEVYSALRERRPSPLAPLVRQYGDFAISQRAEMSEEVVAREIVESAALLAGAAVQDLPTDYPRPARRRNEGASISVECDAQLSEALKRFARDEGTSVFGVMLAALNALLARYTGQEDVVVGTTITNRPTLEAESILGPFIAGLAIRTDLSGDPSARDLVGRSRESVLNALEQRELPFHRLIRELRLPRDPSRTPLYQVMFIMLDSGQSRRVPNLGLDIFVRERSLAPFDVMWWMYETPDGFAGQLEYSTTLFDVSTAHRLAQNWKVVLASILSHPERRLSELPAMSDDERHRVVDVWNETDRAFENQSCIHETIEQQAARTPDAVAVVFEGQRLTYRDLNVRANQLAHRLRKNGATPDALVAVCLERSLDLVVTLLAVLKSGGAYVPLDPSYPKERLHYILKDAAPSIVLTSTALRALLAGDDTRTICVDEEATSLASEPSSNPPPRATLDHVAYAIYTSGSTGRPKGALNTHRGIANRLMWMQNAFNLDATDAVLQKTPSSFDVSVWEFFWPLMFGAKLVVASPGGHRDPAYLAQLIDAEHVTTTHFVPSMLQVFLEEPRIAACTSLRTVICSGEALAHDLQERFFDRLGAELHNLYGPTEAAVDVSAWRCERGSDRATVPIGRPIANTQLHVLDRWMQPVPIGVVGELYIGGVQLARGYLNRPALTAERFVPSPFRNGERLYRTGDLARTLASGALEFLGRLDHQIKVRGFRVELGEVESVLLRHPQVRDAVVHAKSDEDSGTRLVGYVVPKDRADAPSVETLRQALALELPEYMIPGVLFVLDELPLLSNGKVDRNALPTPFAQEPAAHYVAPGNATEARLASMWRQLLQRPYVSVTDDFFSLGGHSLLAARLLMRVRSELGVDLPLHTILEAPTVRALAARIAEGSTRSSKPRLERSSRRTRAPLSPNQLAMWHWQKRHPTNTSRRVVLSHRLEGNLDVETFQRAVDEEFRRREALRSRLHVIDGEPEMRVMERARWLEIVDWTATPRAERAARIETLATQEWEMSSSLEDRDLVRLVLIRFAADAHVLLLSTHHIALDLAHCQTLFSEVFALYQAFRGGRPSPLPEPRLQYSDYAFWRRQLAGTAEFAEHREYWRRTLADAPPLALPFANAAPPVRTQAAYTMPIAITDATLRAVDALASEESVSRFVVFSTVFALFLSRVTSQSDIVFLALSGGAQAKYPDLMRVIGCFLDTLPLRIDVHESTSLRELVRRARDVIREARVHDDVPAADAFGDAAVFDAPLARALINYFNDWTKLPTTCAGLKIEPSTVRSGPRVVEITWSILPGRSVLVLSSDTFDEATAARLANDLSKVLIETITSPDARRVGLSE